MLKEAGINLAPGRQKRTTWKEFLRNHTAVLAATDFFPVEVRTAPGLARYYVLVVIRLATEQVQIAGSSLSRMACGPELLHAAFSLIAMRVTFRCA